MTEVAARERRPLGEACVNLRKLGEKRRNVCMNLVEEGGRGIGQIVDAEETLGLG